MKRTTRAKLLAEYAGLRALVLFIKLLPWGLAVKFGEIFGLLLSKIIHKRFKRTVRDIQKAFPDKTRPQCAQIAKESFINMGRMAAEFVKASGMSREKLLQYVQMVNFDELLNRNNQQNLGGILHIGHFINWELLGLAAGRIFNKMAFVARPQTNPYVDKAITKMRTATGAVMLSAYNPFFSCIKYLKKGYMIGILSDQSVPSAQAYMNFLGRPAEAGVMSAVLAIKLQVPVYPVRAYRKGGKICIEAQGPLLPPKEYNDANVFAFTRDLMAIYEDWIRRDPAAWLWAHNRWKREAESLRKMQRQAAEGGND